MVAKVSTAFKHSNFGPGSYESEANLQDVMVAAREEGQHKDGAFLDKDDDGQYPKRSGVHFDNINIALLQHLAVK